MLDILLSNTPVDGVDPVQAEIDNNTVPQCAMNVERTSELGKPKAYSPVGACDCYFDSKTGGDISACKTCEARCRLHGCRQEVQPRLLRGEVMSLFKKNSLAVALVGAVVFSVAALQGCSSDEQTKPAAGGSGGSSHAGSGGKANTAGTGGKPMSEGGAAGEATHAW